MASALTKEVGVAQTLLDGLVDDILSDPARSDHDKNYLLLVIEASCQRLGIPEPEAVVAASRVYYPRVSTELVEQYPIALLIPE